MNLLSAVNCKRKKIWDIPAHFHCSILGTCLDKRDMKRLDDRLKIKVEGKPTAVGWEHGVHSHMVNCCAERTKESKYINKYLDRKFRPAVRKYSRLDDDASLAEEFHKDKKSGAIRGAYWAIMTHPAASEYLILGIYGELHMLAHHLVPKYFKDSAKILEMERRIDSLHRAMAGRAREHAARERALQEEIAQLRQQVQQQVPPNEAGSSDCRSRVSLPSKVHVQDTGGVRIKDDPLRGQSIKNKLIRNLKKENKRLVHLLEKRESALAEHTEEIRKLKDRISFLKREFEKVIEFKGCGCADCNTHKCPGPDLCGRRLLYVGGRNHLVPHYKELAQKYGAVLLHHDGGREASVNRLPSLMSQVDTVLCPVDCISHDACTCIKKITKKFEKSFVPIRSSGISSLARCLENLGRNATWQ